DEQLPAAISHIRDTGDRTNLPTSLQNLAECLGHLGQGGPAQAAAAEALTCAQSTGDRQKIRALHAYLGWLADLVGDTTAAEQHFTTADQICLTDDPDDDHLYSHGGDLVGRLAGPHGPSQPGPEAHPPQCPDLPPERLDDHVARCDRVLGRLALAAGDTAAAGTHLTAAAGCFRDGDYLTELAATLPSLADWAKATRDLDTADQYATEAIYDRRPPWPDARPLRGPGRPRPHPRRPGRRRRRRSGPAVPGPGRRQRRAAPGRPPPPALERTRCVARPRR